MNSQKTDIYQKKVIPYFRKKLGFRNNLAIPKIEKIVINAGIGKKLIENRNFLEIAAVDLAKISGQKPKIIKSKRAISGFKLKKGAEVGLMVTLRGKRMNDFLIKLINIVFPRIRDFKGIKETALDQSGNLNIGIAEQIVFPEIKQDQLVKAHSFQINIVTNAKDKNQAKKLFQQLGFIFAQKQ